MRALSLAVVFFALAAFSCPASAAIDKLQKEDFPAFGIGILNLYYNIGKSCFEYVKTCVVSLPNLPKGVAVDVFNVGQKGEPAYYLTKKERRERERQKRLESRLKAEEEKARAEAEEGKSPITAIKE